MCTLEDGRTGNLASVFTMDFFIGCPDGRGFEVNWGCGKLLCIGGLVIRLGSGLARDGACLRISEENV